MKIELNLNRRSDNNPVPPTPQQKKGGVVIGKVTRVREMIDIDGNVIDPRTKRIITKNEGTKIILN